jgi:hypothetical protein
MSQDIVFIDGLVQKYIYTTQRDGSYLKKEKQIANEKSSVIIFYK